MKKVLIIGGLSTERDQTKYGQFFSEFIKDHSFDMANFDELAFSVQPNEMKIICTKLDTEVKDYDLVMFRGRLLAHRDLASVVCTYLKYYNVPFFNDYLLQRSSNKLVQAAFFFEQKVAFPQTFFAMNSSDLKQLLATTGISWPIILKDVWGSHGENNFLVKSEDELDKILSDNRDLSFIAQPYHPNSCDYRVLIMGDQKPLIIKRMAGGGSHLNNTSQGGSAELLDELPAELIAQAKQLAENSGMVIAGVDILPDSKSGQHLFLEINSQPQILTGAFVDEKHAAIKKFLNDYLSQG